MVFINDEKKELFIHIPKCGGCHIRNILMGYYNYTNFFDSTNILKEYYNYKDSNIKHHKLKEFCDNIDENVNDKHTITKKGKYRFFLNHQDYCEKYIDYFKYTFV